LLVFISLEHVTKGGGSNNLTKVIIDVLNKKGGGVSNVNVVGKLMSFGDDGVNVF
jgi:hypothetical protein